LTSTQVTWGAPLLALSEVAFQNARAAISLSATNFRHLQPVITITDISSNHARK
jgi:hypothetical protein